MVSKFFYYSLSTIALRASVNMTFTFIIFFLVEFYNFLYFEGKFYN